MPEVSVVVPGYNHANFLSQRLDSVFNQTFKDFEVILLDDHSNDNSVEILERYASRPQVVKFIKNTVNSGSPFLQWIKGVSVCSGRYVWIAESDDYCEPVFLERCMKVLQNDRTITMVYTASAGVTPDGTVNNHFNNWRSELSSSWWTQDYVKTGKEEITGTLSKRNTIGNTSSVVIERISLNEHIEKLRSFRYTGDWYLWISVLSKRDSKIAYVAEALNYFRTAHDQSTRTRKSIGFQYAEEWFKCLLRARKAINAHDYPPVAIADMRFILLVMPLSSVSFARLLGWLFEDSIFTRMALTAILKRGSIWITKKGITA
jgi:glycosyltransferase involved in cell wall biosynthesis